MPTTTKAKTGFEKPVAYAVEPEVKEEAPAPAPKADAEPACVPVPSDGTCPNCGWTSSDPAKGVEPHEIYAPSIA